MAHQGGKLALSLHQMLDDDRAERKTTASSGGEESDHESGPMKRKDFQPYHAVSVPKSENLEENAKERAGGLEMTTMMLRNIPNKYTQNTLMQEINDFGYGGTYNFFYLPMDVHNRSNVGYAFINFEKPEDADRFHKAFADHRFQRFHSRKIGSVCVAHVQGLEANLRHFENRAVVQARNDQYRPVVLQGNVRVDFEEAVAKAKLAEPASQVQNGQGMNWGKKTKGGKQSRPQQAQKPAQPARGTSDAHAKIHAQLDPASQPRDGLEAAIRELLAVNGGGQSPLLQQQIRVPGLPEAEAHAGGPPDIAHLLSLRSLLVDRLVQKNEMQGGAAVVPPPPPPGLGNCSEAQATWSRATTADGKAQATWSRATTADCPAYVNLTTMSSPYGSYTNSPKGFMRGITPDMLETVTPRTNGVSFG